MTRIPISISLYVATRWNEKLETDLFGFDKEGYMYLTNQQMLQLENCFKWTHCLLRGE